MRWAHRAATAGGHSAGRSPLLTSARFAGCDPHVRCAGGLDTKARQADLLEVVGGRWSLGGVLRTAHLDTGERDSVWAAVRARNRGINRPIERHNKTSVEVGS